MTTTERKPKVEMRDRQGAGRRDARRCPTLKDQVVSVGDEVGTVSPGTLSVTGTLTPDQQYRLVGAPTQASRHPQRRPGPVRLHRACGVGAAGTQPPSAPTRTRRRTSPSSGTVTLRRSPRASPRSPGLGATVEITNGTAADVVVVPITAVQGTVQKGNVWVVAADGEQREAARSGSG